MATTSNNGWTIPADTDLVRDGALAIRTLGNGIDTSFGKWLTTWTPTIGGTGWATGTATLTGRYHRIGDTVHWYLRINNINGATKGTGGMTINLPTTVNGTIDIWGTGVYWDASTSTYYRLSCLMGGNSITPYYGSNTLGKFTSSNYPVIYQVDDYIELTGTYRSV